MMRPVSVEPAAVGEQRPLAQSGQQAFLRSGAGGPATDDERGHGRQVVRPAFDLVGDWPGERLADERAGLQPFTLDQCAHVGGVQTVHHIGNGDQSASEQGAQELPAMRPRA